MSEQTSNEHGGMSRRTFTGLGAAAGVTAAISVLPGVPALAGPPRVTPLASGELAQKALGPVKASALERLMASRAALNPIMWSSSRAPASS